MTCFLPPLESFGLQEKINSSHHDSSGLAIQIEPYVKTAEKQAKITYKPQYHGQARCVTVHAMKPGERITASQEGNTRCEEEGIHQ